MLTRQRFLGLKKWAQKNLCEGRSMKVPPASGQITTIIHREPKVYLGYWPGWANDQGQTVSEPVSYCPGILISWAPSEAKAVEELRFDTYNNVHRSKSMGQSINVSFLFCLYEPGTRLPGFIQSGASGKGYDMSLLEEGTEDGFLGLFDWLDDCKQALITQSKIPGTDLTVDERSIVYSPYSDSNYAVDKRPMYYGFVSAKFYCYADDGSAKSKEETIENYLI